MRSACTVIPPCRFRDNTLASCVSTTGSVSSCESLGTSYTRTYKRSYEI